jgi:hypothetical protein
MSEKSNFNLEFRPIYFGPEDLKKHFGARVKGELRRQAAMDMADSGNFDEKVMSSELNDDHRQAVGAVHPWLMGGEYLPDFMNAEVEIARVTLASTTMDVTSIRAQRSDGCYDYRIVDEYENEFDFEPKSSETPLSMKELIRIIDECELVTGPRNMNLEGGCTPEEIYNFATVTSVFYPELVTYYTDANEDWLENKKREDVEDEERYERESRIEAERREKILAPYQERIATYVLGFSDERLRYPGGGSYGTLRSWAERFIEEYLLAHGELPRGEHYITVKGYSGPKHDFSDL